MHDSDCATHNAPAKPAGPCDCSAQRRAVLRGLKEWRSPPWYGEELSLETIITAWATPDEYPSQKQIAEGEKDGEQAIEQIADMIVAELRKE